MSNNLIGIGVLGCANIAKRSFIPAIKQSSDKFILVAVASRNPDKAREFSVQFQCQAESDYDCLLSRDDIDAVYMPLPSGVSFKWIKRAISLGKHVYVEKSFSLQHARSLELVGLAKKYGVALVEGYMFLHHPQHELIRKLLADGVIGELRSFYGCFGFPPLDTGNFRYDARLGGGALYDAAGYPLRAAWDLCGQDLRLTSSSVNRSHDGICPIWGNAFLSNANGFGAAISYGFDNEYRCHYELWGSLGHLSLDKAFTARPTSITEINLNIGGVRSIIEIPPSDHFVLALTDFWHTISDVNLRLKHYGNILTQSGYLESMEKANKRSSNGSEFAEEQVW
jgi:predicted dehydrogenase